MLRNSWETPVLAKKLAQALYWEGEVDESRNVKKVNPRSIAEKIDKLVRFFFRENTGYFEKDIDILQDLRIMISEIKRDMRSLDDTEIVEVFDQFEKQWNITQALLETCYQWIKESLKPSSKIDSFVNAIFLPFQISEKASWRLLNHVFYPEHREEITRPPKAVIAFTTLKSPTTTTRVIWNTTDKAASTLSRKWQPPTVAIVHTDTINGRRNNPTPQSKKTSEWVRMQVSWIADQATTENTWDTSKNYPVWVPSVIEISEQDEKNNNLFLYTKWAMEEFRKRVAELPIAFIRDIGTYIDTIALLRATKKIFREKASVYRQYEQSEKMLARLTELETERVKKGWVPDERRLARLENKKTIVEDPDRIERAASLKLEVMSLKIDIDNLGKKLADSKIHALPNNYQLLVWLYGSLGLDGSHLNPSQWNGKIKSRHDLESHVFREICNLEEYQKVIKNIYRLIRILAKTEKPTASEQEFIDEFSQSKVQKILTEFNVYLIDSIKGDYEFTIEPLVQDTQKRRKKTNSLRNSLSDNAEIRKAEKLKKRGELDSERAKHIRKMKWYEQYHDELSKRAGKRILRLETVAKSLQTPGHTPPRGQDVGKSERQIQKELKEKRKEQETHIKSSQQAKKNDPTEYKDLKRLLRNIDRRIQRLSN